MIEKKTNDNHDNKMRNVSHACQEARELPEVDANVEIIGQIRETSEFRVKLTKRRGQEEEQNQYRNDE